MSAILMQTGWGRRLGKQMMKPIQRKKPVVDTQNWKILRGDNVQVIKGKCEGQKGKILAVLRRVNQVIVEGVNMRPRYIKSKMPGVPGKKIMKPCAVHYSNVMVVDPSDGKPTKTAKKWLADGTKVRVSKRTGHVIPNVDFNSLRKPRSNIMGKKDTLPEEVLKVTFPLYEKFLPFIYANENKEP